MHDFILLIDDTQQPALHQVCPSLILLSNCGFPCALEHVVERDAVAVTIRFNRNYHFLFFSLSF